jgi:putative restriction endonuclease
MSDIQDRRQRFWEEFLEKSQQAEFDQMLRKGAESRFYYFPSGIQGWRYTFVVLPKKSRIELYFESNGPYRNRELFERLLSQQNEIHHRFGGQLTWDDENKDSRRISYVLEEGGVNDEEKWSQVQNQMIEKMMQLESALRDELQEFQSTIHLTEKRALIQREIQRRKSIMEELKTREKNAKLKATDLRELGVYGGGQGIWVDKAETARLTTDGNGVTVSVLHTGSSYADDLNEDSMEYHYPLTDRQGSRDMNEVEATKNAMRNNIPIFVISFPSPSSKYRDVRLGWVTGWDDDGMVFWIDFGDEPTQRHNFDDSDAFQLKIDRSKKRQSTEVKVRNSKFRFDVLDLFSEKCAFCEINIRELLDAAHLCPVKDEGVDHPRNGLPLCPTHHRAFDQFFIGIEPNSHEIQSSKDGPSLSELKVSQSSITHLTASPHPMALEWCWEQFQNQT